MSEHPTPSPRVYVIDDHPDELLLIRKLCASVGYSVSVYDSPSDFLNQVETNATGCVVVDLLMPQMSGLQLHSELKRRGSTLPIIVITGHANASTCRAAFQSGVFDFVEKSFQPHDLLSVVQRAMKQNADQVAENQLRKSSQSRIDSLSGRERDVMQLLADGKSLKEIGEAFKISVQTVSKHRGNLFTKLEVANEVELLKLLITVDPDHERRHQHPLALNRTV